MVYYGAASRGCERCRKRKVKCDEQKPQCHNCNKLGLSCLGYRDMKDVLFRDESERIIKNAHRLGGSRSTEPATASSLGGTESAGRPDAAPLFTKPHEARLQLTPAQPMDEVGANFFFAKYAFELPPFYKGYDTWISQAYFGGNPVLRPVVEAVGMAGLANITNTSSVMLLANRRYEEGIVRVNEALNDPVEGLTDETFLAIILLAFFETVSFQSWDRYNTWLDHIKAATALLELRGKAQFSRPRGAQLFIQIQALVLLACVQQRLTVPPALVQASWWFQSGSLLEKMKATYLASPGSISEISLRLVNLRAAVKNEKKKSDEYRTAAAAIDVDLIMWSDVAPTAWTYATVDVSAKTKSFNGKRHVYNVPWAVETWNNWRALRIAANQIMLHDVENSPLAGHERIDAPLQLIRQMSLDICTSVSAFADYDRVLSLIRPLYIVATESRNSREVRTYAVDELRQLGMQTGVRQPVVLADTIQEYTDEPPSLDGAAAMVCETLPLLGPY